MKKAPSLFLISLLAVICMQIISRTADIDFLYTLFIYLAWMIGFYKEKLYMFFNWPKPEIRTDGLSFVESKNWELCHNIHPILSPFYIMGEIEHDGFKFIARKNRFTKIIDTRFWNQTFTNWTWVEIEKGLEYKFQARNYKLETSIS